MAEEESDFREGLMAQARRWTERREALSAEKANILVKQTEFASRLLEIEKETAELNNKLKASSVLIPEMGIEVTDADDDASADVALTDAIIKALVRYAPNRTGLSRDQIRRILPRFGYDEAKISSNPNYLYIALKRLEDRGNIKKQNERFYFVKK